MQTMPAKRLPGRATIGLVAASGFIAAASSINQAVSYLEAQGHRVILAEDLDSRWKYFAGPDDARLAALHAMISHPEVDVIMAFRGGYGLSRIVAQLDFAAIAESSKSIVGFSDFTILHLASLAKVGKVGFAGPMGIEFAGTDISRFAEQHLWRLLQSASHRIDILSSDHPYSAVELEGVIWGGNLSCLAHLVGTPYFPCIDRGILFLEDINEDPYRVERMLFQLGLAGVLDRQEAILLGDFTDCVPTNRSRAPYTMEDVVETLRDGLRIPVLTGLPFGHIKDKITIPVGGRVRLSLEAGSYSLEFFGYN